MNVVQDPIEVNGDIPIGNNLALVGSGSVFCGETYSDSSLAYNTIQKFINSAKSVEDGGKGGFYIGRYEQGNGNVCKKNQLLYTNLTGSQASAQAQLMYNGNEYITSELISSYAWDTALNFICQTNQEGYLLATVSDSDYSNTNFKEIEKTGEC